MSKAMDSMEGPAWAARFLEALKDGNGVRAAAREAGVTGSTPYDRRRKNQAFREAWDAIQPVDGADLQALLTQPGALPLGGMQHLALATIPAGCAGNAHDQLAPMHERNLGRENGIAAHKTLGAVDGIDQPEILGIQVLAPKFLAVETMLGEDTEDHFLDHGLGGFVHFRDRAVIALVANREIAAVGLLNHFSGGLGGLQGNA